MLALPRQPPKHVCPGAGMPVHTDRCRGASPLPLSLPLADVGEPPATVQKTVKEKGGVRTVVRADVPWNRNGELPWPVLSMGSPAGLTGAEVPVTPPAFPRHPPYTHTLLIMNIWLYLIPIPVNIWPLFHTGPSPP